MTLLVSRGMRCWLESPAPAAEATQATLHGAQADRAGTRGAMVAALASMFISTIGGA